MNQIYRIVWNEARGAFVVAHENSKANGKPSSTRKAVASAVVMALAAMAVAPAMAVNPGQTWSSSNATITNSVSIAGSHTGIKANSTFAGSITNSGTISGASTVAGAHTGINIITSTITGSITNSGSIVGSTGVGINITNNSTLTGSISNSSGGSISGSAGGGGLVVKTHSVLASGITNSGFIYSIMGFGYGTIAGGVTNSGALGAIVEYFYSTISGGITNSGSIASQVGIDATSQAINTVAGGMGIANLAGATISGGIYNAGLISGYSDGIKVNGAGSLVSGGITNSGTISGGPGTNATGILINGAGTLTGGINNASTGTISGVIGIKVATGSSFSGGITNSGKITATSGDGLQVNGSTISGTISNLSGGTISGGTNGEGISITASGKVTDIVNAGSIAGNPSFVGIYVAASTVSGGIANSASGVLSGGNGIFVASGGVVGSISNAGTISSGGIAISGINTTVAGGVVNSGSIAGGVGVFSHAHAAGGFVNTAQGIISGGLYTGIAITANAVSGSLTNSGTISGGRYAVYVDSTSTLSGITITGANTAKFSGDVFAQNTPVTITSGSTFTGTNAFNVQSFNIASAALFNITNSMPGVGTTTGAISNAGITTSQGVTNAGTISVADGVIGHITGNYIQASTGVYQLGASSNTSYGKLAVSGTASLAGTAYVNVNSVNTIASGQTLTGVITSSGLTGNFASVSTNSNLFGFSSVANGNNVDLCIFSAGSSCGSGGGSNGPSTVVTDTKANGNNPGAGAAVVFDNLIALGANAPAAMAPVITALGRLTTSQEVSNAVAQTLPLHTGGETPAITASLHSVNHIVQSRQEGEQGRSSGDGFIEDGKAWVKPFGSYANQGDYEGVNGFKAYTGGVVLGADADINSTHRVGVALAVASTNVSGNSAVAPQSSNVATYQLAIYGSHSLNDTTDINFQADLGDHLNSGNRGIPFMGVSAQSSYRSLSEQLGVGIAHTMKLSDVTTFTPTARVDYTTVHNNGYTESGAGPLDLIVDSSTVNEMIISTDGKFTHKVDDNTIVTANLGVGYDALNKQYAIVSAFAGDPTATFTTLGLNPSPWIARGGLGYVHTEKATEVMLRYDVDASTSHFVGQTVSARFRWSF